MANPLTLYVPIKQDDATQLKAIGTSLMFKSLVKDALDATKNVHYARLSLIPNAKPDPETGKIKINAILLITSFDQDMTTYLNVFWNEPTGSVKAAFIGLAGLMENGPEHPESFDPTQFVNFITTNNLNKQQDNFYQAYPDLLVTDILDAPCLQG